VFYAPKRRAFLAPETLESDASHSYVHTLPLQPYWEFALERTVFERYDFLPQLDGGQHCVLKADQIASMANKLNECFLSRRAVPNNVVVNLTVPNFVRVKWSITLVVKLLCLLRLK